MYQGAFFDHGEPGAKQDHLRSAAIESVTAML
jgi:hypothetical protein